MAGADIWDRLLLTGRIDLPHLLAVRNLFEDLAASRTDGDAGSDIPSVEAAEEHIAAALAGATPFNEAYRFSFALAKENSPDVSPKIWMRLLAGGGDKLPDGLLDQVVDSVIHFLDPLVSFYGTESSIDPRRLLYRAFRGDIEPVMGPRS